MNLKRLSALCAFVLMVTAATGAAAETTPQEPTLLEQKVEAAAGSVAYPQLTGMADAVIQQQANAAILQVGKVEERITRLQALSADSVGLTQTWEALLRNQVLSVVFSASGALQDAQSEHSWSVLNLDLTTGDAITIADLFSDEAAATEVLSAYMEENVLPELSAHLEASQLTPLPESFALTPEGITFYYDRAAFSTLSGRAGKVTVLYSEVRDYLLLGEGEVLTRVGAEESLTLDEGSAEKIRLAVEAGHLPGVPASIQDDMSALIDRYAMLIDPDYFPGGRFFQLEDDAFRGVFLLTDALTEGWENSIVQGIRADRANFYGLITGVTKQEDWRTWLGEPDASVELDEEEAYAYYLSEGTSDYYSIGAYRLRLHANEDGILQSLFITQ